MKIQKSHLKFLTDSAESSPELLDAIIVKPSPHRRVLKACAKIHKYRRPSKKYET